MQSFNSFSALLLWRTSTLKKYEVEVWSFEQFIDRVGKNYFQPNVGLCLAGSSMGWNRLVRNHEDFLEKKFTTIDDELACYC